MLSLVVAFSLGPLIVRVCPVGPVVVLSLVLLAEGVSPVALDVVLSLVLLVVRISPIGLTVALSLIALISALALPSAIPLFGGIASAVLVALIAGVEQSAPHAGTRPLEPTPLIRYGQTAYTTLDRSDQQSDHGSCVENGRASASRENHS